MYTDENIEAMGSVPTLAPGEHILWRGKPKKSAYVADKALAMLPIAAVWLVFDLNFLRRSSGGGFELLFMAVHMLPVWLWLGSAATSVLQWRNEDYYLTNKRIIIHRGIFKPRRESVFLRDVHSIRTHYGLLDRLFGSGDIYMNYAIHGHGKHRHTSGYFLMNLSDPEPLRERIELLAMDAGVIPANEEIYY